MKYSENPDLDLPVVVTATGKEEYQKNCRKYKDVWYIIDEECAFIGKKWYYITNNNMYFDCETNKWTASKANLFNGIVDFDEDNNIVLGYFSGNVYNNVNVYTNYGTFMCMDYRIIPLEDYVENKTTGDFFALNLINLKQYVQYRTGTNDNNFRDKGYNIEDNTQELPVKIKRFRELSIVSDKPVKKYARLLGNITWGTEIEFSNGCIPEYLQNQLGIVMCRDGSTNSGGEAVTVPYTGYRGLQSMKTLAKVATERLESDLSCSFHLHLGTLNLSRYSLVSLYRLGEKIQDELFQMFPYYKTNPEGIKKKNYNKKLEPLFTNYKKNSTFENFNSYVNHAYKMIFRFLSEGVMPNYKCNAKKKEHPMKNKWDRASRYYWLNLSNVLFSKRGTVEFRIHHATLNGQKMINWLFICNAIVKYADANVHKILLSNEKISLNEVLDYYKTAFPNSRTAAELSDYLKAYVESRKAEMQKDFAKRDYEGTRELSEDKEYFFSYKDKAHLF